MSPKTSSPNFKWVPCYRALADAIRANKGDQDKLLSVFNTVSGVEPPFAHIDPFSIFASFNRGQKWETKSQMIRTICTELGVETEIPQDFAGIPVVNNLKSWFTGGGESDYQYCWRLFELALEYADYENENAQAEFAEMFDAVLAIKNIGVAKLTMALYWIRPETFLPFDSNTIYYLKRHFDSSFSAQDLTGFEYLSQLEQVRMFADMPFYELSAIAYEEAGADDGWWPRTDEYNPGFTSEQWLQLLDDRTVFSDNALALLKRLHHFGGEATCVQLSGAYGESPDFYKTNASATAKKIADKTGCPLTEGDEPDKDRYWPVLFRGKKAPRNTPGTYIWKLRPELSNALDKANLAEVPLYAERSSSQAIQCWLLSLSLNELSFDDVLYTEPSVITAFDENDSEPREIQRCFHQAKAGDLIIGLQGKPQNKAKCICRVEATGEDYFLIVKIADAEKTATLVDMKKASPLAQNAFIKAGLKESLIPLNTDEFACLVNLMGLPDYSIDSDETEEEAMSDNSAMPLNTILYGPPGTSKTYKTMAYAVGICDGEDPEELYEKMSNGGYEEVAARYKQLKAEERIAFLAFHQSYGYEEFIEGIRPVLDSDADADDSKQVHYDISDGAFKAFCAQADATTEILASSNDVPFFEDNPNPTVWKIGLKLESVPDLYKKCHEDSVVRLGWDQVPFGEFETDEVLTKSNHACIQAFEEEIQPGDLFVVPGIDPKLVSIGVISGDCEWRDDYPAAKRTHKVKWLGDFSKKEFKHLNGDVQLTLKTVYKLNRVNVGDLLAAMGKVPATSLSAESIKSKPYVFIIDEINRGNISHIFGELITLLEESKRLGAKEEMRVRLPYSGYNFGVPSNVFVLGTMNTADRSIALMDTALRRRFSFKEMMPDDRLLKEVDVEGVDIAKMLRTMNTRIEFLYDREHTIGHAYLIPLRNDPSLEHLAAIFRDRIIPLLQEYFYDDYAKIRSVLGLAADDFIACIERDDSLFPNDENVRPASVVYQVCDTPTKASSYIAIYSDEDNN